MFYLAKTQYLMIRNLRSTCSSFEQNSRIRHTDVGTSKNKVWLDKQNKKKQKT